jgi:hypothetical protein
MKYSILITLILCINTLNLFSQDINDLGKKSYYDVKSMNNVEPCEITFGKVLTYCVTDGSRIAYLFKDNILNGIMFQTPYLTKSQAELALQKEVVNFELKNNIKPSYGNGGALFYYPNSPISVSFGVRDFKGTPYLLYYTWLAN